MEKGYEFVCKGQYYVASGRDRFLKNWGPEKFFLPDTVEIVTGKKPVETKSGDGIISKKYVDFRSRVSALRCAAYVIQRKLLPIRLAEKYPDAVSFRTCNIISTTRTTGTPDPILNNEESKSPLQMSLAELKQFCSRNGLDVPLAVFQSLDDARQAVVDAAAVAENQALSFQSSNAAAAIGGINPAVMVSEGKVTSADNVPTDQEDPAADLV